jgi:hypothetical protein
MIRNLKALLLAVLVMTAFSALAASAAQAASFTVPGASATEKTTLKLIKDGTGKTAHQVLDISKSDGSGVVTFTCEELTGSGAVVGSAPAEAVITTPAFTTTGNPENKCEVVGQPEVKTTNTGCDLTFTPAGEVKIVSEPGHNCAHSVGSSHEAGKEPITMQAPGLGCTLEIGAQTLVGNVTYHNVVEGKGSITVQTPPTATPLGLIYNAYGVGCPYGTTTNGKYTTGNAIVEGFTEAAAQREIKWDA